MSIPGLDLKSSNDNKRSSSRNSVSEINIFSHNIIPSLTMEGYRSMDEFEVREVKDVLSPIEFCTAMDLISNTSVSIVSKYYIDNESNDKARRNLIREIEIMRSVHHPHIHKFYSIVFGNTVQDHKLVFEKCHLLFSEFLNKNMKLLSSLPVIKCIMWQLFTALQYLHERSIAHRDIQPESILMQENGILKLTNFRNARRLEDKDRTITATEFRYQPLDQLMENELCSKAVDIWAATCVLVHLFLKRPLFEGRWRNEVIFQIIGILSYPSQDVWKDIYDEEFAMFLRVENPHACHSLNEIFDKEELNRSSRELIMGGIQYDPKHRYNIEDCLCSEFFRKEPKACLPYDIASYSGGIDHAPDTL